MSDEIYIVSVVVERFKTDPNLHSGERYFVVDSSDVGGKNYPTYEEAEGFAAELRQRAQDILGNT